MPYEDSGFDKDGLLSEGENASEDEELEENELPSNDEEEEGL